MNVTKEFLEKVRGLQTEDWVEVDRLLKTLRYIIGIAERGEGRKCGEDESPEQFVLEYVKKLEAPRASFEMKLPEGWPTREMVDAAWHEIFGKPRLETNGTERITYALTAALAAAPTPPAPEVEPVGFVAQTMIDGLRAGKRVQNWILPKRKDDPDFCDMNVPLYTHANDGLRKAAEMVLEEWEDYGGISEESKNNLRAELDKGKS